MQSIDIYMYGSLKERFTQRYRDRLGELLAAQLEAATGFSIDSKRFFIFAVGDDLQIPEPAVFILEGDLIGSDNFLVEAEITWREGEDMPIEARWSRLNVRELRERYGGL